MHMIYGEDSYLIKQWKNKILNKNKNSVEVVEIDLCETKFEDIFNNLWTESLFFEKKVFIIENFDILFLNNSCINYDYLLKLHKNSNEIVFIFRKSKLPKTKEFKKFIEGVKIHFTTKQTKNDLRKFILQYLEAKKNKISSDAIEYILNFLPNSIWIIKNELDKIATISNNIDINIIKNNINNYIEGDVFKLVDSILGKNAVEFEKNYFYFKNNNLDNSVIINLLLSNIKLIRTIKILKNNKNHKLLLKFHPYRIKMAQKLSFQ